VVGTVDRLVGAGELVLPGWRSGLVVVLGRAWPEVLDSPHPDATSNVSAHAALASATRRRLTLQANAVQAVRPLRRRSIATRSMAQQRAITSARRHMTAGP
jgi:hypothetical protein